jgi:polar amino acid transport system substrate-binding protein
VLGGAGRIRSGIALCAVLALLWMGHAPAARALDRADDGLVFVGDASFPPIEYLDHGVPRGLAVDTVKALAEVMGRRAEVRLMRWLDAQQQILDVEADGAAIMSLSHARSECFDFTTPVFAFEFSVFFRLDEGPMHRLMDLEGRRVGVINGGLTRQVLETHPGIELVSFDDYPQGFGLLRSGEVDAMAGGKWVGAYTVQRLGIEGVGIAGEPFATVPAAIAVKKGNHRLLAQLNEGIARLKDQGRLSQIYEDWSPATIVFLTRERLTRIEILGAALVSALVLLGVLLWIFTLKRQVNQKTRLLRQARDGLELPFTHKWSLKCHRRRCRAG